MTSGFGLCEYKGIMTTSKNGRVIYVHQWTLGSRGRAENEPMTVECAENEPIINECAEYYTHWVWRYVSGIRGS